MHRLPVGARHGVQPPQLQPRVGLRLRVLQTLHQLKVLFHARLSCCHLALPHGQHPQVPHRDTLPAVALQPDGDPQRLLVVLRRHREVPEQAKTQTQVARRHELAPLVGNLQVPLVALRCLQQHEPRVLRKRFAALEGAALAQGAGQVHVVHSEAVACQTLHHRVAHFLAHGQELLVGLDGFRVLLHVVVRDGHGEVGLPLHLHLARALRGEGQNGVVRERVLGVALSLRHPLQA
mmetsp:Transcript_21372/g.42376  ORF Transcript_21372/g.42376 Transcript_21372/m.42376 type:complete len:235 (+) Transcript_21372:311-1015(+)